MNTKKKVYEALSKEVNRVKLSMVDDVLYSYDLLQEDIVDFDTDIRRLDSVANNYETAKGQADILKQEFEGQWKEMDLYIERFDMHQSIIKESLAELQKTTEDLGLNPEDVLPNYNEILQAINQSNFENKLTATILNTAGDLNLL
jgi:23S rRNA maturation mini-RNase III